MVYDSIINKENYRSYEEIYQALCFLEKITKWKQISPNTTIKENHIFANPVSFVSKDEKECMYEAHQQFIDLHYIIEGEEKIATADVKNLNNLVPYDKDKDIGFYDGVESGRYLLKAGDFMVCFPSDAHKVAMMDKSKRTIVGATL